MFLHFYAGIQNFQICMYFLCCFLSKTTKDNFVSLHEEVCIDVCNLNYYLLLSYLSVYFSFFLCLFLSFSHSFYLCLFLSHTLSLPISLSLSIYLSLYLSLLWIIGNPCKISQNYLFISLFLSPKVPLLLRFLPCLLTKLFILQRS